MSPVVAGALWVALRVEVLYHLYKTSLFDIVDLFQAAQQGMLLIQTCILFCTDIIATFEIMLHNGDQTIECR